MSGQSNVPEPTNESSAPPPLSVFDGGAGRTFLHLFGLSTLAIAQPLLGRLGVNDAYIEAASLDSFGILISAIILLLGLPGFLFLAVVVFNRISLQAGRRALGAFLMLTTALLMLLWLNWTATRPAVLHLGLPGVAILVISIGCGAAMAYSYFRRPAVRGFLSILSFCALAVPLSFCGTQPILSMLPSDGADSAKVQTTCGNPVPVVMIVCDGMCGMALLNEDHQLDAERYPGFARLASMGTWYRNASTVHYRTDKAVPAILTGCHPGENLMPTEENYPDNLFRMILDSQQYEMTVFEPYTRLCSRHLKPESDGIPLTGQVAEILSTLGRVYLATTVPADVLLTDGLIPKPWFGLPVTTRFNDDTRSGLLIYTWDHDRRQQFQHFQNCLISSQKPGFRFLHIVAPHYPWTHLPDGREYLENSGVEDFPIGAHGALGEDWGPDELTCHQGWQRYLLQLGFVDRRLDQLISQMEAEGILDESLLIVVGDHGAAFAPNTSRRIPTSATLPDIMSVPLFIKLPGQTVAETSDRNVETIDILPTIADVLEMAPTSPTDGSSLLSNSERERPRKQMTGPDGDFILEPDFPRRFDHADRLTKLFGSGDRHRLWSRLNAIPELIDRPLDKLTVSDEGGAAVQIDYKLDLHAAATDDFVPCFLQGRLLGQKPTSVVELAVSVNGHIRATTRTYIDPQLRSDWATMVPEKWYNAGKNDVRIYQVIRAKDGFLLKRCPLK